MMRQRTIKGEVKTAGVGLHSGQRVQMTLRPAPTDTGIVFTRVDLEPAVSIKAEASAVNETTMATTLTSDGPQGLVRVQTIEHLMSALAGLGVDNLYVDVTATEIPILDGSASSFVFLIQSAGLMEQAAFKQFIQLKRQVRVGNDKSWAQLDPHFGFRMAFSIDFGHPAIDSTSQEVAVDFAKASYVDDVSKARTFGFTHEVDMLRDRGLAQGGSFGNAIVMDETRVLNDGGLRSGDEFVKHKMLDAIGDLYVIGGQVLAAYSGYRSGHALNNQLIRAVLADPSAWEAVRFTQRRHAPRLFTHDWGLGA